MEVRLLGVLRWALAGDAGDATKRVAARLAAAERTLAAGPAPGAAKANKVTFKGAVVPPLFSFLTKAHYRARALEILTTCHRMWTAAFLDELVVAALSADGRVLVDGACAACGERPAAAPAAAAKPGAKTKKAKRCLLYTSPSPRDKRQSRMPSSA